MNPKVRISINDGKHIDIELYPDVAPISVNNFLKLVDEGFYDGVVFHRIIKNFMIQTGGYYISNNSILEKPKTETIKGEFKANGVNNELKHTKGVISMARTNVMDSATSQFFICSVDTPHLDGLYAAFGRVIDDESLEEVIKISKTPTTSYGLTFNDFPREHVLIETIKRIK